MDLVQGGHVGAYSCLAFCLGLPGEPDYPSFYAFGKDENEVGLSKGPLNFFFRDSLAIKNNNVRLVLGLTAQGSDVLIQTLILDLDDDNAVLFDRTVTATPGPDPMVIGSDSPPQSHAGRDGYFNPFVWNTTESSAEVIFDNAQVCRVTWPPLLLEIRRGMLPGEVVLSWPVAEGPYLVDETSDLDDPWAILAGDPTQMNGTNYITLDTTQPQQFFRLRSYHPLEIATQPQSQSVTSGDPVTFSVTATGEGTLYYQWRLDGVDIAEATDATLTISNVQPIDAGDYSVVVTDDMASVTSDNATLTVLTPPEIVEHP